MEGHTAVTTLASLDRDDFPAHTLVRRGDAAEGLGYLGMMARFHRCSSMVMVAMEAIHHAT